MMEAKDMAISVGVNSVSVEDELTQSLVYIFQVDDQYNEPHPDVVLHHEFMECFCRVCHVDLAFAIAEICLRGETGFQECSSKPPEHLPFP